MNTKYEFTGENRRQALLEARQLFVDRLENYDKWFMDGERVSITEILEKDSLKKSCAFAIQVINEAIEEK